MTLSAREVSLRRQEEEVVHDGDGVGDDPQQPVLLPLGRLHQVPVLVQVVMQQREPFASHSAISWLPGRGRGWRRSGAETGGCGRRCSGRGARRAAPGTWPAG